MIPEGLSIDDCPVIAPDSTTRFRQKSLPFSQDAGTSCTGPGFLEVLSYQPVARAIIGLYGSEMRIIVVDPDHKIARFHRLLDQSSRLNGEAGLRRATVEAH